MTTTTLRHHSRKDQRCTAQRKKRRRRKRKRRAADRQRRKGQKGRDGAAGCQKPRGGQRGRKGMTCKPKPTKYETHTSDSCPGCGSGSLWITKTLKRNITKAPRTVKAVTTPRSINTCRCRSCGRDGIEPETGLPNNGSYDPSITTEVADGYACRTPFRMIADRARRYGITLSSGTVHNIMRRPGASPGTPTADTATAMRRAGILHIDETSLYLNGRTVWVDTVRSQYRTCVVHNTWQLRGRRSEQDTG